MNARVYNAIAVLAALLATGCSPSPSEKAPAPPSPTTTRRAAPAFAPAIDTSRSLLGSAARGGFGVAIAVYSGGNPVWLEGTGYADRATHTPVDPQRTLFRIYSVAKAMTATAGARLMEEGALDPSAPVQRYVPSFPQKSGPITAMELATHTSGIRHYKDAAEAEDTRHCSTIADALKIFENDPLVHPPGEEETYSSWGYVLLSGVIAGAAHAPFLAAMHRLVFDPVGMSDVALDDPRSANPDRASFYQETGRVWRPAKKVDNTCKWGAGAFLATAEDVAQLGAAMFDGTLLSPRSRQLFLRGGSAYEVEGVGVGGTAFLLADASNGLVIALLSNTSGDTVGPALQAALTSVHDAFVAQLPEDRTR